MLFSYVLIYSVNKLEWLNCKYVPGGGLSSGNLPNYTILRLKKALDICKLSNNEYLENCLIIPLSFGTTHKPPPRDELGFA